MNISLIHYKKSLIDRINNSFETDAEFRQILNIIQTNNIKFTENANGCFIDLAKINNKKILTQLENVIKMCEDTKKYFEESNKAYFDAIKKL